MCLLKTNLETLRFDVKRMISFEKHCERHKRHKQLLDPLKTLDQRLRRIHCTVFHLFDDLQCHQDSSVEQGASSWRLTGGVSRSRCHEHQCSLVQAVRTRIEQLENMVKNIIIPTLTALSRSN